MDRWIQAAVHQWEPHSCPSRIAARVREVHAWSEGDQHCVLPLSDPRLKSLRQLPSPPPLLWGWGRADALSLPQVTLVGTRRASAPALGLARRLGQRLGAAGVATTSGLALGVDGACHRGSLDVKGITIAVLGGGLHRLYPRVHRGLAEAIVEGGGLVLSEFPPDHSPRPYYFPRRNRLLGALGRATVLVEAGEKSGAHSTLQWALHCHRSIWIVPSPSAGNQRWLADGAPALGDWEQLLEGEEPLEFPYADQSRQLREWFLEEGGVLTLEDLVARLGRGEAASVVFGAVERGEVVDLGGQWFGWTAD